MIGIQFTAMRKTTTISAVQNYTSSYFYMIGYCILVTPFWSDYPKNFFSQRIMIKFGKEVWTKFCIHWCIGIYEISHRFSITSLETSIFQKKWFGLHFRFWQLLYSKNSSQGYHNPTNYPRMENQDSEY